jgi:putative acetyltransferase
MSVTYRKILKEDNPVLAKMIRSLFEIYDAPRSGTVYSDPTTDNLNSLFQKEGSTLNVAVSDGLAIGCCGVFPTEGLPEGYVELVKFYLDSEYHGIGIGKKLFDLTVEDAVMLGYDNIYLESLPHFSNALRIYENYGFRKIENPMGNSCHSSCNIWMVKEF